MLFGFSLAFSETGSVFIGDFAYGGLQGIGTAALQNTAPQVPAIAYCLYQMQFATITPALIFGSVAERIRILPAMVFIFLWSTVVYDPIAYWTWSYRGWIRNMSCIGSQQPCGIGSYDYAGGGPVHMASGFAGLAYCLILGKRRRVAHDEFKPHNLTNVFLGTALIWFGWFGFNGGSAVASTPRAAMAGLVTTIAASAASLSWMFVDYLRTKKMSGLGFCSGAIAGLVAITPASGFVAPWAAIVIGASAGVACNFACLIKEVFGFDDSLDAWGVHAIGGLLGNILTGMFADSWVGSFDGAVINGGWINHNYIQVGYQLAGSAAIATWAFVASFVLLYVINKIPGLSLRVSEESEGLGGDLGEMGEVAYELVPTSTFPNMASSSKSGKLRMEDTSNNTADA